MKYQHENLNENTFCGVSVVNDFELNEAVVIFTNDFKNLD